LSFDIIWSLLFGAWDFSQKEGIPSCLEMILSLRGTLVEAASEALQDEAISSAKQFWSSDIVWSLI